MKYTLQHAVNIAEKLEPHMADIGLHVAIGGSCVYRGGSDKDIDIFLYPHSREVEICRLAIARKLLDLGFEARKKDADSTGVPDVLVTAENATGYKVDFFFLERHTLPSKAEIADRHADKLFSGDLLDDI